MHDDPNLPTPAPQRRDAYRVRPHSKHHPRLLLTTDAGVLRLVVLDLSAQGLALVWPTDQPVPAVGTRWARVELELERDIGMSGPVRVEHVRPTDDAAQGAAVLGCAFEGWSPAAERQLMLYLTQLQQRQRLFDSARRKALLAAE